MPRVNYLTGYPDLNRSKNSEFHKRPRYLPKPLMPVPSSPSSRVSLMQSQ